MGSGLETYITSELAKVAKGDLVYSGSPLGGARFTFTFVMDEASLKNIAPTEPADQGIMSPLL